MVSFVFNLNGEDTACWEFLDCRRPKDRAAAVGADCFVVCKRAQPSKLTSSSLRKLNRLLPHQNSCR